MSDDIVRFEELKIRRGAGFAPPGLAVDSLCEGINVIYGKNASGKTTLARAIRTVLWPDNAELGEGELVGVLRLGERQWRIDYDGGRVSYQQDGVDVDHGPQLVHPEVSDRYVLGLTDLLATEGNDFASLIVRESAGGYDVEAAGEKLNYGVGALRSNRRVTRQLSEARDEYREANSAQRKLHQRALQLEELDRTIEEARQADRQVQLLRLVREFREIDRERMRLQRRLDEFPQALGQMAGDEDRRLETLRNRHADAREEVDGAEAAIADCEARLRNSPVGRQMVERGLVASLENQVEQLDDVTQRRDSVREKLVAAEGRERRVRRRIAKSDDLDVSAEVDDEGVEKLTSLADALMEVQGQQRGFELLENRLDGDVETDRVDELKAGVDLLRRWLSEVAPEPQPAELAGWAKAVLIVFAVATVVVAVILAVVLGAVWLLLGLLATGPLAVFFFGDSRKTEDEEPSTSSREVYRRDFERLEVEEPSNWDEDGVRWQLEALIEQWAALEAERSKQQLWEGYAGDRQQLRRRLEELEKKREELEEQFGLKLKDPAKTGWLVAQIVEWQRLDDEVAGLGQQLEQLEGQRAEVLEGVNATLEQLGFDPADGPGTARGAASAVREAAGEVDSTVVQLKNERKRLDGAQERCDSVKAEIEALFDKIGVEEGDDAQIVELCELKSDYDEVEEELIGARRAARDKRERLDDHPGFRDELLELSDDEVQRRLETLEETAQGLDELKDKRSKLAREIELAKESTEVERKRARYEQAQERMRNQRESKYRKAIGAALVDHVREKTRDQNRPRVFHRARELFEQITRGQYRLDLTEGDDGPVFRAYDNNKSRGFALNELSGGTRVQLLMSVRLAFVECQEQGAMVPMVLDETLANSDDVRAPEIIRAIEQIGAEGRQIFYLTAQLDEVAKWKRFADDSNLTCQIVEIDESGGVSEVDGPVDVTLPIDGLSVPAPEGMSHEDYGEALDVGAPVGLWTPVTDVHLWYFVEDVELLVRLLKAGVRKWGQLKRLAAGDKLDALGVTGDEFAAIEARADAVEAFFNACRVGRGRPVTARVIEQSGAVSDTFFDRVVQLCDELEGDGEALVAGLLEGKVKRFRDNKAEELEEYLVKQGYIDEVERLSDDEIWEGVLAAVADALGRGVVDVEGVKRVIGRVKTPLSDPSS